MADGTDNINNVEGIIPNTVTPVSSKPVTLELISMDITWELC